LNDLARPSLAPISYYESSQQPLRADGFKSNKYNPSEKSGYQQVLALELLRLSL